MQKSKQYEYIRPDFLDKVKTIIEEQLHDERFGVERLQKDLTISYPHMYRKIKDITGLSPSLYIRQHRLNRAAYLLQNSEFQIGEIAYKVGFNTPSYFTNCFIALYGVTPSVFRGEERGFIE